MSGGVSVSSVSLPLSVSQTASTSRNKKLSPQLTLAAGALSGGASLFLLQPLDVIKTRLQQDPSTSFSTTLRSILSSPRGPISLWRGTLPTLVRNVPGSALYFATLNEIRSALHKVLPSRGALVDLLGGGVARAGVGFVLMPATVLKVRYESNLYQYGSMVSATRSIMRTEGVRGLFSGFGATALRDAPQAGLYVLFYEQGRKVLTAPGTTPTTITNTFSALLSGLLSTLLTQPFDTVKTLIQLQPSRYSNTVRAVGIVLREGGVAGFFKGGAVRIGRKVVSQAVTWTVYEEVVRWGGGGGGGRVKGG